MKYALLFAPILLIGCSEKPDKIEPKAPSVLILQCDGTMVSSNHRGEVRSVQQRRTVRIDLDAKQIAGWHPEKKIWQEPTDAEIDVSISETEISWSSIWSSEKKGEEGASYSNTIIDRQLATITSKSVMMIPNARYDDNYTGKCIKVDEPSTDVAF